MGDPAGVGPEICLRALNSPEVAAHCVPAVFGDAEVLRRCAAQLGENLAAPVVSVGDFAALGSCRQAVVVDVPALNLKAFRPGKADANTAAAGYAFVQRGIDAALAGKVDAVVTAPLNKEALRQAGVEFPGHTEIFAHRTRAKRWCMMQYSEELTCAFVTTHAGYAEVPSLLTSQRVLEVIRLSAEFIERLRGKAKIAVCGLNPHAGERGLFGNGEEERIILPSVEAARREGLEVEGPLPPDTAFLPSRRKEVNAVVCMYHDQGHIPIKALAFDSAVNITLGLPIVRASVDHGTAMDIAWQGKASPSSLFHALRLAGKLVGQTTPQKPNKLLLPQK